MIVPKAGKVLCVGRLYCDVVEGMGFEPMKP